MNYVNVLWMAKYTQQWSSDIKHAHSFFQMLYTLGGEGTIVFEDECFQLEQDKLYLCHPNKLHTILYNEKNPIRFIDIKFSIEDIAFFNEVAKLPISISLRNHTNIRSTLNRMLKECLDKRNFYFDMVNAIFFTLLVDLLREVLEGNHDTDTASPVEHLDDTYKGIKLGQLLEFIGNNYDRIISVDDLSKQVNLNKSYLINLFKDAYGTTPLKYINSVRMAKAKELLIYTDLNITEISTMVGFQSIHYFSRCFKEKEVCSPLEYRIKNKGTHFVDLGSAILKPSSHGSA